MAAVRVSLLLARGICFNAAKLTPRLVPGARNVARSWNSSPGLCQAAIRSYSNPSHLEDCLKKELKLERSTLDEVPIVSGFEISYIGSQAVLTRQHKNEIIKVEVDANHAVEVASNDEEDEDGPFFVPAFTVTVTKPPGSSIELECSFDEEGSYNEQGNEWDNLRIDSICVLPTEGNDNSYTADTQFLSEELLESLKDYLEQRGINQKFSSEIIEFYQSFEHHNYVNNFLGNLQKFLVK